MSSKDRKEAKKAEKGARAAVLREFLVAMPGALERMTASLGWLVLLGGIGLIAFLLHLAFGGRHDPPPRADAGENPVAALYVRDLGRLPDGRHTFDLAYTLVLRNVTPRPQPVANASGRLMIGDSPPDGDAVDLGQTPAFDGKARGAWHDAISGPVRGGDLGPGQWHDFRAHYRLKARADQFADVAMVYEVRREMRGWFGHRDVSEGDWHHEEVQLGAVLRAHCALGVKVQHGEMRSLCGS